METNLYITLSPLEQPLNEMIHDVFYHMVTRKMPQNSESDRRPEVKLNRGQPGFG